MNPQGQSHSKDAAGAGCEPGSRHFGLWLAAIFSVACAAYIDLAAEDPIFQRAEDYFAEAAREMSALSQHITPILYGRPFFDKPIWSYWMIQGGFALLGPTHFAARLPSIVAALATLALVAYAAWKVWGRRTSLMATAVLATSYTFFYYATMAMSDMWLTLFCTAAMIFLFAGSETPNRRVRDWCIASALCGLAVLTKGPVGAVLPAAACAVYLAIRRGLRQIGVREALAGIIVFAAVAVPWYALLWRQQGTGALRAFFFVENLQRFMGAAYTQAIRPWWYIPLSFVVDFLPWTIFLPAALAQSVRSWRTDWNSLESRAQLFLWCYIGTVVGFFWVARVQMDYYVLPAMPACAVLTGLYLHRAVQGNFRFLRIANWAGAVAWLAAGVALAAVAVEAKGAWQASAHIAVPAGLQVFWPLAIWMMLCGVAAGILTWRKRYMALMGLTLLGFCGAAALAVHEAVPFYLQAFPIPRLASQTQHDGEPAALSIDLEHWRGELSFENRRVLALARNPEELSTFVGGPGPHLAILTDRWRAKLPPKLAGEGHVIYTMPLLRQGITLRDILDPKVVSKTTDGVAVVYFPGTAPAD